MNAERRKAIAAIVKDCGDLTDKFAEFQGAVNDVKTAIEELRDAEQEALDNLSDNLKEGEKGSAMQEAVDALEAAIEACDNLADEPDISEITGSLENAAV